MRSVPLARATALLGSLLSLLPFLAPAASAAEAGYRAALFADEADAALLVVVSAPDGRRTGVEGRGRDARLLEEGQIDEALARIRRMSRRDGVSVVDIDRDGTAGVEILAEDQAGGESAWISIGEGGIVLHAGEGEESVYLAFGDSRPANADGAVRIHARGGDDDEDQAVVMLRGLDEAAVRDFIDDLDDVPADLRGAMKEALGLR